MNSTRRLEIIIYIADFENKQEKLSLFEKGHAISGAFPANFDSLHGVSCLEIAIDRSCIACASRCSFTVCTQKSAKGGLQVVTELVRFLNFAVFVGRGVHSCGNIGEVLMQSLADWTSKFAVHAQYMEVTSSEQRSFRRHQVTLSMHTRSL